MTSARAPGRRAVVVNRRVGVSGGWVVGVMVVVIVAICLLISTPCFAFTVFSTVHWALSAAYCLLPLLLLLLRPPLQRNTRTLGVLIGRNWGRRPPRLTAHACCGAAAVAADAMVLCYCSWPSSALYLLATLLLLLSSTPRHRLISFICGCLLCPEVCRATRRRRRVHHPTRHTGPLWCPLGLWTLSCRESFALARLSGILGDFGDTSCSVLWGGKREQQSRLSQSIGSHY